jgi:hypothetical protein
VTAHPERGRAIFLAKKLTLSDSERRELAEWMVEHTGSWSTLKEEDAKRIADALNCFIGIQYLLARRNQRAEERMHP